MPKVDLREIELHRACANAIFSMSQKSETDSSSHAFL
jgi:hypothetical protein